MAFFHLPGLYFGAVFPVPGVNPVISVRFGQYGSSPGNLGHAMGVVLLLFRPAEAFVCKQFGPIALPDAAARFNGCHHQQDAFPTTGALLWVKIPEQTEPPFRGKLNQMLKDGFANQI
jgi:hypothetical protein